MKLDPKALEAAQDAFDASAECQPREHHQHLCDAITAYLSNLQPPKEVRELVVELRGIARYACWDKFNDRYFSDPDKHPASRAADLLSRMDGEGWRTVPVEPTEAMYAAAEREWDGRMSARSRGVWQAMLAAAPSPSIEDPTQGSPAGGMLP